MSISENGHYIGFFSCKRGVRQGDPLSPLLFCLAEEVLSRGITNRVNEGQLQLTAGPRGYTTPSHVLNVYDILIFCVAIKKSLHNLMTLFKIYENASGQMISSDKSKSYTDSISSNRLPSISATLGFSAGSLPFTYQGVPIFKGQLRKVHLQPIADMIKCKLDYWKGNMLSIMGRVQLVKSAIMNMLLYSFHFYACMSVLLRLLISGSIILFGLEIFKLRNW